MRGVPRLTGEIDVGDDVVVNEQARLLELGSGGFDVLYANLTRGLGLAVEEGAHVMALPYTPGQVALRRGEEDGDLPESIGGLPVVLCTVHSQVAPACAALGGTRVAYVQVAGGALPVSLSDTIRVLKRAAWSVRRSPSHRVSTGTWIASAPPPRSPGLRGRATRHRLQCRAGIVGTGTFLGHGALALADAANVAGALGGKPILALRMSDRDPRNRHRGTSHHTQAVRDLVCVELASASPDEAPDDWQDACEGLPLSHMGRGLAEDEIFFRAAFAAGLEARKLVA